MSLSLFYTNSNTFARESIRTLVDTFYRYPKHYEISLALHFEPIIAIISMDFVMISYIKVRSTSTYTVRISGRSR